MRTSDGTFCDLGLLHERVLFEDSGAATKKLIVQGTVIFLSVETCRELGIERAQCGVDAESRIGIDNGHVPIRFRGCRRTQDRSTKVTDYLRLRKSQLDNVF